MNKEMIKRVKRILQKEEKVLFAYLYGSAQRDENYNDIDIGVYIRGVENPLSYSVDLNFKISESLNTSPDVVDIQVINNNNNPFYLYDVLNETLLIDRQPEVRGDFIESCSMQYRESIGILDEAFS